MSNRIWLSILLGCFWMSANAQVDLPDTYKDYCTAQSKPSPDMDFTQPPLKDYCNQLKQNSSFEYTKFVEGFLNDTKVTTQYSGGNTATSVLGPSSQPEAQTSGPVQAAPAQSTFSHTPAPTPAPAPQGSPITY